MRREREDDFFWEESLKIEGDVLGKEKKKSSGRILVDFLNEIQKKIVNMEITFPGGTSKERIS